MRRQPAGARRPPLSETFALGALLAAAGGFLDAYTYLLRGGVFANAQTGNIVLLSQNLFTGNWAKVPHYLVPLVFFALGIAAAEGMRYRFQQGTRIHWRQLILLEEIVTLFAVGLMPASLNMLANATVSFSCAMQVQAFRKVNGYAMDMKADLDGMGAMTMAVGMKDKTMNANMAFTVDDNAGSLVKLTMTMDGTYQATSQKPSTQPPAGAQIVDLLGNAEGR